MISCVRFLRTRSQIDVTTVPVIHHHRDRYHRHHRHEIRVLTNTRPQMHDARTQFFLQGDLLTRRVG